MTAFTVTWDASYEALPADSEDAKDGASRIRSHKLANRERQAVDHFIAGNAHDGKHKKVTFRDFGGDPTLEADDDALFVKVVGGKHGLYYKDKDGNVVPIVTAGSPSPTGATVSYVGTTAPAGWVMLSGRTIGDATSGGTERANADTEALFTLLWNSMADAQAPVSGGRGASAAADYAAHKTITLPDARGRAIAGWDFMTGASANRLTGLSGGVNGDTLGLAGGEEAHTLSGAESGDPGHGHPGSTTSSDGAHTHTSPGDQSSNPGAVQRIMQSDGSGVDDTVTTSSNGAHTHTLTIAATAAAPAASAHNNVQPTLILNVIAKL